MNEEEGFTLVELLAVIVILAAIMVIAIPAVLNTRRSALGALSKEQEKNLKDAGKLLGVDLDDYASSIYDCKEGSWIMTSSGAKCTKTSAGWAEVKIDVPTLVQNGYFKDENNHCSGTLTITKTESGYRVMADGVKC